MASFKELGITNIDMIVSMTKARNLIKEMNDQARAKVSEHIKDIAASYMEKNNIASMSQLSPEDAVKILDTSFRAALKDNTLDKEVAKKLYDALKADVS